VSLGIIVNAFIQGDAADVKNLLSMMKATTSLRLSPDTTSAFRHVGMIVRNIRTITSLHLDLRSFRFPTETGSLCDLKKVVEDGVAKILFKYMLDKPDSIKSHPWGRGLRSLRLTTLVLWNVDLTHCSRTWMKVIDTRSLRNLELSRCLHAGLFLSEMWSHTESAKDESSNSCHGGEKFGDRNSESLTEYKLESLKVEHYGSDSHNTDLLEEEIIKGLNECFRNLKKRGCKLKMLILRLNEHYAAPSPELIGDIASSLESLYLDVLGIQQTGVDDSVNKKWLKNGVKPPPDFIQAVLSKATTNLRQLGLIAKGANVFVSAATKDVNPVTLAIHSLGRDSNCVPCTFSSTAQRILHQGLMRHGKEGLRLRVIAFTQSDFGLAECDAQFYVRCTVEVLGRSQDKMMPIDLKDLRKHAVEVDILDHMPFRLQAFQRA
jgi:hypothetical protein